MPRPSPSPSPRRGEATAGPQPSAPNNCARLVKQLRLGNDGEVQVVTQVLSRREERVTQLGALLPQELASLGGAGKAPEALPRKRESGQPPIAYRQDFGILSSDEDMEEVGTCCDASGSGELNRPV